MVEPIIFLLFFIVLGLCWGSFLNVVAYRFTFDEPFFTCRSHCPSCKKTIVFYDNIPVISWILLNRRCRQCNTIISWIYPFIEVTTSFLITALALHMFELPNINISNLPAFFAYFILFSALIVATATDFHAMVIPQLVTVWLIPIGIGCAFFEFINISLFESIGGIILGYGILWLTSWLFKQATHQDGIGEGDFELLAMIGSFLGIKGVWFSLMGGSVIGLLGGGAYLMLTVKNKKTPIPFGPCLAIGAIIFFFYGKYLSTYLLGGY